MKVLKQQEINKNKKEIVRQLSSNNPNLDTLDFSRLNTNSLAPTQLSTLAEAYADEIRAHKKQQKEKLTQIEIYEALKNDCNVSSLDELKTDIVNSRQCYVGHSKEINDLKAKIERGKQTIDNLRKQKYSKIAG